MRTKSRIKDEDKNRNERRTKKRRKARIVDEEEGIVGGKTRTRRRFTVQGQRK